MNRSVFRDAFSKGDQDTCLKSLESGLSGDDTLVQYLNDLLFTAACVDWKKKPCDHPAIVMNSLKNMIGENRETPSKILLKFGLEILDSQPLRKDDDAVLNETTRSGIGLAVFVGDLEDALQECKWNEAKLFAAKTFLASDRSRAVIDALADLALQNTNRNGAFVFHLLRSFHFQELKEDIWNYVCSLLNIIEQHRLPKPHERKTVEPHNTYKSILINNQSDLWVTFSSVWRLWIGENVRLKSYQREISHWLSVLDLDANGSLDLNQDHWLLKDHKESGNRFIALAESIVKQDKPSLDRGRDLVILESLRALARMDSNECTTMAAARLEQRFES